MGPGVIFRILESGIFLDFRPQDTSDFFAAPISPDFPLDIGRIGVWTAPAIAPRPGIGGGLNPCLRMSFILIGPIRGRSGADPDELRSDRQQWR